MDLQKELCTSSRHKPSQTVAIYVTQSPKRCLNKIHTHKKTFNLKLGSRKRRNGSYEWKGPYMLTCYRCFFSSKKASELFHFYFWFSITNFLCMNPFEFAFHVCRTTPWLLYQTLELLKSKIINVTSFMVKYKGRILLNAKSIWNKFYLVLYLIRCFTFSNTK